MTTTNSPLTAIASVVPGGSDEDALNWLLASRKGGPPFRTATFTPGQYRKAKFFKAFFGTFVVTGIVMLMGIGYTVNMVRKAATWDEARQRLAEAKAGTTAGILVGGHLLITGFVFLCLGGFGGRELLDPSKQLTIDATPDSLTISAGDGTRLAGPWNSWLVGPIETISTQEGPPSAVVSAIWVTQHDAAGNAVGSYRLAPDCFVNGERYLANMLEGMLASRGQKL